MAMATRDELQVFGDPKDKETPPPDPPMSAEEGGGDKPDELDENEEEEECENAICFCFCEPAEDQESILGKEKEITAFEEDVEEEEEPELVDPQDELRETCGAKPNCQSLKDRLDECTARVESKSKTTENCSEEVIDFMHCVDHCVAKSLWSKLK